MKNRRLIVSLTIIVVLLAITCSACLAEFQPFANPVFIVKSASINNVKKVIFSATANITCSKISVTSVKLQKKSGNTWGDDKTLTAPTTVAKDTISYLASKDYSSDITSSGTYRVVVVFDGDGTTTTATSNEITY